MTLWRYLARLIWLCVLPLVVLAVWFAVEYVSDVRANRDRVASDQARNAANAIDRFLQSNIHGLQVLAASPLAENPVDRPLFYREALGFREHFGGHIVLAAPDRRMLFNTRVPLGQALPELPRPKGYAAVPEVLATGVPSIGDAFLGPVAGERLFAVVVPVVREGRTINLLLSTVEIRQLQARLDAMALPAEWSLALVDSRGEVLAAKPADAAFQAPGEPREGRFAQRSSISRWTAILDIPPSEYHAPVLTAAAVLLAVIFGTTLASLLGGLVTSRRLALAVAALAEGSPAPEAVPPITEFEVVRRTLAEKDAARDRAEATLRGSEHRFRTLVEAVPNIAVQGYDRNRRVIFWNSASEALYGFTREEVLGRRFEELIIPSEMREEVIRAVSAWVDGGRPIEASDLVLRHKDGSPVNVYSGHAMLINAAGEPEMYCIDVDLSALRRAESETAAWRRRYLAAIRASGQILHEWNPSTGEMTVMGDTERILGYAAGEMAGGLARWREMIHPEDLPAFDRALEQALDDRVPFHQQYRVRRKDGDWITFQDDGYVVLDDAGKVAFMVCFVVDVTERVVSRRQIELQLEELQRWYRVTLGREGRIDELKDEVNKLRHRLGEPPSYRPPDRDASS